jgi:hypothetical protein
MNKKDVREAKKTLVFFTDADNFQKRIASAKNELESTIYSVRERMYEEEVEQVSTDEDREKINEFLSETRDWLDEQVDDGFQKFEDKMDEMHGLTNGIFHRARELVLRGDAIGKANDLTNYTRHLVLDLKENKPWIHVNDTDKLLGMVDEVDEWLANKTVEQAALALTDPPAYNSSQLINKLRPVAKYAESLMRRKKPAEKEVKKDKKSKKKANGTNETETPVSPETETEEPLETGEEPPKTEAEAEPRDDSETKDEL